MLCILYASVFQLVAENFSIKVQLVLLVKYLGTGRNSFCLNKIKQNSSKLRINIKVNPKSWSSSLKLGQNRGDHY